MLASGFVGNDMIYGVAKKEDIIVSSDGEPILPLYEINIVGMDGKNIKNYSKAGIYVMNAKVQDEKIYLQRSIKQNNFYVSTEADFIMYKAEEKDDIVRVANNYDKLEMNQIDLQLPSNMYISDSPTYVITKNKENEIYNDINIKTSTKENTFYVFNWILWRVH